MANRLFFPAVICAASLVGVAHAQTQPSGQFYNCPGHPRCPQPKSTLPPAPEPPPVSYGSQQIYFAAQSAVLQEPARAILDEFAAGFRATTGRVLIAGHDDSAGTSAESLELSRLRVATVRDYLIAQGIGPARLETAAHGESQPAIMTADGVSEPLNRRVEILPFP